jgi:hypothetical protein
MKDIQKLKEFFSKPLEESLTGGYPHTKTSGENFEKITITEPIDDATKSKMIKNFRAAGWDAKPNNGGGITAIKKAMMEAKEETAIDMAKKQLDQLGVKYEMSGNEFRPFKTIYRPNNQSDSFYEEFNRIVYEFNLGSAVEQEKPSMNEAKEEDVVDTITMDVPLFIRMLEYSREDASADVDLHDVTEKAISLNKEKDILSMDDYSEIVGAAEEIKEGFYGKGDKRRGLQNASKLSSAEYQMAKKLKSFKASDWKWNADEDLYNKVNEGVGSDLDEPYFIEVSVRDARKAMDMFDDMYRRSNIKMHGSNVYAANTPEDIYDLYYDFKNQDIEVLDYNVDGDLDEATDYMKRRKAQDDYAVSKKDKPTKSYNPKPSGKTDYMKSREKELAEAILTKLKK